MSVHERDMKILLRVRKYCREIELFIAGIDFKTFEDVLQINRSCIFTLEQIGESVKHLSDEFRTAYNYIPWQEIVGMRNRIVHDYDGIYLDVVWETVTEDIPGLLVSFDIILKEKK